MPRSNCIPGSIGAFAALLVFLLAGQSPAAEPHSAKRPILETPAQSSSIPVSAIFRILNGDGREYSIGTGTLVARTEHFGIVLTCAHIFDEKVDDVTVIAPDGVQYGAEVCAIEKANDLSLLWIARPNVRPVPVARRLPSMGDPLTTIGYGSDGTLLPNHGRVVAFAMLDPNAASDVVEITGVARQGDSGGPMLDRAGQVVGVIIGTDGKSVDAMGCEKASKLLAAQADRKPANPSKLTRSRVSYPWIASESLKNAKSFGDALPPALARTAPEPARVELTGRLTINGRGVPKAKVELAGYTQADTTTDAEGRFRFAAVPAGYYSLRAEGIALNKIRSVERQVAVGADKKSNSVQLKFE
jgi:S1-C subfamily serine protease